MFNDRTRLAINWVNCDPKSKIKSFTIKSMSINNFFEKYLGNHIDYLSIDIEGLDYETIMSINFEKNG